MEVAALGLRVDGVQQIDQAATSLEKLGKASEKAESSAKKFDKSAKDTTKDIKELGVAAAKAAQEEAKLAAMADKAGMSVNQMKAALRGVPAQFTDIAVSLQGGMNPLTVFLQQGGQLKDMFGGAGTAARALAGYVRGLISPLSLGATAVVALGAAYYQGSKEANAFRVALASTGNSAGLTTSALISYSESISNVVGTQGKAVESLNMFISAGVRGTDTLAQFTQTAIEWEKATGEGVDAVAEKFRALQDDPLKAALKLNEGINFLTLSVYEQIKSLEEQGRATEAAQVAMEALDSAMADRSKNIIENLGYIEIAANGVASAFKWMWDGVKNIGRDAPLMQQLAEEQARLNQLESETVGLYERGTHEKRLATQRARVQALRDEFAAQELNAAADKTRQEQVQNQVAWDKIREANLDKQTKMERELTQVRNAAAAAGVTGKELEDQLAAVREKYAEKTKKASQSDQNAYKSIIVEINKKIAAVEKEIATGDKLTEAEQLRLRLQEEIATRGRKISQQEIAQAEAKIAQYEALERYNEALKYTEKSINDYTKAQYAALAKIDESVEKLRLEEEAHALAAEKNISHAEAVERLTIARLEEARAQMQMGAGTLEEIRLIDLQIEKRKQMLSLLEGKAGREASEKAFKDLEKAGEKSAKMIGDTLSDYIMGGGKDAATYLKRLFSNLVLQPVVQTMVSGVLGTGAAAAAGVASGGASSLLGGASSLFSSGNNIASSLSGWSYDASLKALEYGLNDTAKGLVSLGNTVQNVDTWFKSVPGFEGGLGSALGYGSALASLSQGNYGSAIGSALGTWIGAGNPIGTWIGSTLGGLVDGLFGGGNPHDHRGGVYSNVTSDRNAVLQGLGLTSGPERSDFTSRGNTDVSTALGTTIDELLGAYDTLAERATGAARDLSVYAGFATNPKNTDQNAYGYLRIFDAATQDLIYKATHRNSSDALGSDPAQAFSNFTGEIAGVLVQQLKAADLPGWMRGIFDGMGETVTLESFSAAMQQIQAIDYQFDLLGKTMSMFVDTSESMKTSLLGGLGGIEGLTATAQGFYQSYYSEQERYESSLKQMRDVLASLNVSIDPSMGERAKADFRAAVEGAFEAGNGELSTQLLAINQAFDQVASYAAKSAQAAANAAREAANTAVDRARASADAAMRQLEASVNREKTYWSKIADASQQAISSLSTTLRLLEDNANQLYGSVQSASQMQAAQGSAYIEQALNAVKRGASISSFSKLGDAISAATGGISAGNYSSRFEQERDTLILANNLSELGDYTESQLSVEERSLKAAQYQIEQLDQTLQYWQQALEMDQFQIDATMSVGAAISGLSASISALASAQAAARAAEAASWSNSIVAATPGSVSGKVDLYQQMYSSGMSDSDIRNAVYEATGNWQTQSDWDLLKSLAGVPSYDVGTPFVPEDQLALIHKGEAVIPAAYNPFNGAAKGGSTDTLIAQLISDNRAQAGEIIRLNARVARLLERWDGDGLPETREVSIA